VGLLRQADVLHSQGMPMAAAIRQLGVGEVTLYRWRKEYGGLSGDQLRRLKELEKENEGLRRAVSDLTLDKQILQEAARETSEPLAPPPVYRPCSRPAWALRAESLPGAWTVPLDPASRSSRA